MVAEAISIIAAEDSIHSFMFHHFVYPFNGLGAREISGKYLKAISKVRETIDLLNELKIPYCFDIQACIIMAGKIWECSRYLKG